PSRPPMTGAAPQVRYQGPAMSMSMRPMRPMAPMGMAAPPRSRSGGWGGIAALVALLGVGLMTQDYWRPMIAGLDSVVQSADAAAIPPLDVSNATTAATPDAEVASFVEPRDYLVLPTGGALTVALRKGPGEGFPVINRLSLHDSVIGRGVRKSRDGKNWVWVTRSSDGMAGFLSEEALLQRAQPGAMAANAGREMCAGGEPCDEQEVAAGKRAIEARYGELLTQAQGFDRAYLSDGQRLWETQRGRCEAVSDPTPCRKALDTRRMADLEGWRQAGNGSGGGTDAVRPSPGSSASLR
ncbi:hypothetical protein P1X14_16710, partial [Sphingomonas sp. AOB5]|uniref:hypothetical protein n=1 Tax=Sphingomonas sp. AOB5 TaxID=3034017 RepID=UPI0023F95997